MLDDVSTEDTASFVITPVEITPVSNISTSEKVVAFTFDDGPDSELSLQIAGLIEQNGGRATFFNAGKNLSGNEAIVAELLNRGHEIGNHSMTHSRLPDYASDADIVNEIVDFQELYQSNFDYTPKLFRAPYLDYGQVRSGDTITPEKDDRVGGVLTTENLLPINASVYSNDASASTTAADVLDKLQGNINPGDIILCHEKEHTLEALETIIPELATEGYRFVTVSDLLRIEEGWTTVAPNNQNIIVEGANYISDKNKLKVIET